MKPQPEVRRDRSLSQLLKILDAAQVEDRSVNRLMRILEAAQLEMQDLDADFQFRLQEAVQEVEARLRDRFTEQKEQEVKEAEEAVRRAVTQELLARFDLEFQRLNNEFEERRQNAIQATESAAELRIEEAIAEAERVRENLKREFQVTASQWEADVQELNETITKLREELDSATSRTGSVDEEKFAALEGKLTEANRENARLEDEFQQAANRWHSERATLKVEVERSRQELLGRFDAEIEQLKGEFEGRRLKIIASTVEAEEIRFAQAMSEAKEQYNRREQELQVAASQWFQNASNEWDEERKSLEMQISKVEQELARVNEAARIRTPLSKELEAKLTEVTQEKAKLEEEFQEASARWEEERQHLEHRSEQAPGGKHDVPNVVRAEITRIESTLLDITRKMEDPSTDLATEIRLNRERADLEAYLKGLRYSVGEVDFDDQR